MTTAGDDPAAEDPAASAAPSADAPSSSASSTASHPFAPSAEPAAAAWLAARAVAVKGAKSAGCEALLLREWLRLRCTEAASSRGAPTRIDVIKGKLSGRPRGESLRAIGGVMSLIVQMLPSTDLRAQFAWQNGELEFTAQRPLTGDLRDGFAAFDADDDEPAAPVPSASARPSPAPAITTPKR